MDLSQGEVTSLLQALRHGDRDAGDKLSPLVYSELHRVARSYMRRERPNHTLQPTALINEAYMPAVYSCRNAWRGSIFAARRAGM
jgi:RNA polymerase sigma-70 factor (ECF subfamily)